MANSENGWPLVVEAQLEPLAWLPNNARLLAGPVAQVLGYVARQFAARVEPITSTSSFRSKATIGSGSTYSNHASGTALDLNGGRHPQGSKDTFTGPQVGAIRQILAECSGVLRWGGDYAMPITDDMHFEIRPGATAAQVAAAAAALNPANPPSEEDIMASIDDLKALLDTELASVVSQVNETIHGESAVEHAYRARRNSEQALQEQRQLAITDYFQEYLGVVPTTAQVEEWLAHLTTTGDVYFADLEKVRAYLAKRGGKLPA